MMVYTKSCIHIILVESHTVNRCIFGKECEVQMNKSGSPTSEHNKLHDVAEG